MNENLNVIRALNRDFYIKSGSWNDIVPVLIGEKSDSMQKTSANELLIQISDGKFPFLLLYVFGKNRELTGIETVLDPLNPEIQKSNGSGYSLISSRGFCKPDVDIVRSSVIKFSTNASKLLVNNLFGVVAVGKLPNDHNKLCFGMLRKNVESVEPGIIQKIWSIQGLQ
jgi:hypothetical protein